MMIKAYGGRRVLRLSPSLVTCALYCCSAAKQVRAAPPSRTKKRTKNPEGGNPETTPERGRGWVRTRDIESPRIHTPPQPMPSKVSSRSAWGQWIHSSLWCPLGDNNSIFCDCAFATCADPLGVKPYCSCQYFAAIFDGAVARLELMASNSLS